MSAVQFLHSEYKRIFGDVLVKPSQGIEIADVLSQAKELEEKQRDKFAIEFQNFINVNCMYPIIDGEYKGKRMLIQDQKYYTINELLEIYKKENL